MEFDKLGTKTTQELKKVLSKVKSRLDIQEEVTPYQFLFPILSSIYYQIQNQHNKDAEISIKDSIENFINTEDQNIIFKALQKGIKRIDSNNNETIALAYFSWSGSNRLFLARRVFPTYYDFITYSQCPDSWGVLGELAREIRNSKYKYSAIHAKNFNQAALPFLGEVHRIKFKSILAYPILKDIENPNIDNLQGALLFFLGSKEEPKKIELLDAYMKHVNKSVSDLLKIQEKNIIGNDDLTLDKIWKESVNLETLGVDVEQLTIFEIKLSISHCDKSENDVEFINQKLRRVASEIISSLSNFDFFGLISSDEIPENEVSIYIAPRYHKKSSTAEIMKEIGAAIHKEDSINLNISYLYKAS
ncbi:MAG: hypothetical protein WD048_13100 [Chitinophagales bacterium]